MLQAGVSLPYGVPVPNSATPCSSYFSMGEQELYLRKKSRRGALNLEPPAVQQNSKTTRPPQPLIPLGVGVEVFCFNASTVQGGSKGCSRLLLPELGAGLL